MKLPNCDKAVVEIAKLRDYSLNESHEVGGHKARVFRAALGLTVADAEWLRGQILAAVLVLDVQESAPSTFGLKYVVDIPLTVGEKTAVVRTSWIVEFGTDFPRLTSCYVKGK